MVADLGVRMISPAHFFDTAFGGSAHGVEQGGLTAQGRELRGARWRRAACCSTSPTPRRARSTTRSTVSTRPVVASHTGVRGVLDNARNLSDAHLDGIAATGGARGDRVLADRVRRRRTRPRSRARSPTRSSGSGAEHVALGSDWDGAVPVPFDAANTVRLTDALLDVGLDEAAIRAVMGENVLRLLAATLPPA